MAIGEKVQHFTGKNTDLAALPREIVSYLEGEGFETQTSAQNPHHNVIQAKKGSWVAGMIAADRALTILIEGEPADFTVRIGIGKWLEHLGVTVVETGLLPVLFLVDVGEMAWNIEIEHELAKKIAAFVDERAAAA